MRTVRRLLALPPAEQRLLITAVLLFVAVRAALRLLHYATVRRLATRLAHPAKGRHLPAERIAWAVSAAGRRVPGGRNCLGQALVAWALLGHHGHNALIRLGVMHTPGRRLEAHAWLEHNGVVIVGGHGAARYTPLPTLAGHLT